MLTLRSHSVAETRTIAEALARLASVDDVILLLGEMGAGKTAFAQGFGRGLGVDEPITSPTFNLVHTYDSGRLILHHADLYRLDRTGQVSDLALGELVEGDGVLLVEWGEPAADLLGDHLEVRLIMDDAGAHGTDEDRVLLLTAHGATWERRWSRIEAAMQTWVGTSC